MQNFEKTLNTYALGALVLLSPLLFWTITPNFFATPKQLLILFTTLILVVVYFFEIIKNKALTLPKSIVTYPLLVFIVAIVLNLIINVEGRPEAIAGKGTMLLTLPLISLIILTIKDKLSLSKLLSHLLVISSGILALHTLLQLTLSRYLTFLPSAMQARSFTLTGSILTSLILIVIGLVVSSLSLKHATAKLRPYYLVHLAFSVISVIAVMAILLPGGSLTLDLIPYKESWSITLDALKSFKSMLVGIGLSNFSLLYTAVKPLSLNLTSLWNTLPQTSTSELLNLLTTAGLTGAISLIWLMYSGFILAKSKGLFTPISTIFILTSLSLILLPGTIPLYVLFFISLGLLSSGENREVSLPQNLNLPVGIIGIVLAALAFAYSLRPVVAEYYMKQAQNALSASDGKAVYDNHVKALSWYPGLTIYHLSYADVNMNLASALSQKSNLSEADRQTISTLISQSIREAKNAVSLRTNYSVAWQALGKIYRNLINVADGADKFAVDYYGRAVALDPANPVLRVEYGGLFYQLGGIAKDESVKLVYYGRAISEFQTAIQLRPTYANAYYNLSKVLESEKDLSNAYLAMQKVVANLDPSSSEYASALSELETLKTKLPKTTPAPSESPKPSSSPSAISTPTPLPSPISGGPLELPADANNQ